MRGVVVTQPEIKIEITRMDFERLGAEMMARIDDEVNASAQTIVGNAVLAIQNPPKTGHVYMHGKVAHQASAKDEAPASDTTNLESSGTVRRVGLAHYQCVFTAEYAKPLEYGTPDGRVLARPFLRPAVNKEEPVLKKSIATAMRKSR
jgi:hypothetical protein